MRYTPTSTDLEAEKEATVGPQTLVSLHGTASQGASGTELSLFALVASTLDPENTRGGLLAAGEVVYVEFEIESVDDIDLVLGRDSRSGLSTWVNLRPSGSAASASTAQSQQSQAGPTSHSGAGLAPHPSGAAGPLSPSGAPATGPELAPNPEQVIVRHAAPAPVAAPPTAAAPHTSPPAPISAPLPQSRPFSGGDDWEDDEDEDWTDVALEPGDLLRHPKLGDCVVNEEPDDDKVSVRLNTGRMVELHLGSVELTLVSDGPPRIYSVRVRRR